MRGELSTNQKPLLVQTKSQGHLIEQSLYASPTPTRPVSMMPDFQDISGINRKYQEDYGPLIIDSVVQPMSPRSNTTSPEQEKSRDAPQKVSNSSPKSKFGFGLRKSVFSRKKEEKIEQTDSTGTLQKKKDEKDENQTKPRGFGRLSFSRRKQKNQNHEDKNKSSSEDIGIGSD